MMRNFSWMSVVMAASLSVACSDDEPAPGVTTGGTSAAGGATSTAGTTAGGTGGSTSTTAGTTSVAGQGGTAVASGGTGGSAGAAALKDIVDTATAAGSFTELAKALTTAELVTTLKGAGPFTVFAPTDQAFAAFETANPGVLAGLSKEALTEILTYHVIAGAAAKSTDLEDDQVFETVNGSPILVDLTGGVKVGGSAVTMPDVLASNGVIHVVDAIIMPPTKDIVETAVEAGMFTSLAGALTAADLIDTLKGDGPFTVFAPTDDAFDKLASVPDGDALKNVLLYHVVDGAVGSGNLMNGMVPTLLAGESVTVDLTGGVKINASSVTSANIIAKNGVIHVVDTVLIPD